MKHNDYTISIKTLQASPSEQLIFYVHKEDINILKEGLERYKSYLLLSGGIDLSISRVERLIEMLGDLP